MHTSRLAHRLMLLLAPLALLACQGGIHECDTSADCASGLLCVHEHAHDINDDTCEKPCATQDDCDASQWCTCPDSPSGGACTTDNSAGFTYYCLGP